MNKSRVSQKTIAVTVFVILTIATINFKQPVSADATPSPSLSPAPSPSTVPTPLETPPLPDIPAITIINHNENINQNTVKVGDTKVIVKTTPRVKDAKDDQKPVPVTAPTGAAGTLALVSAITGGAGLTRILRQK